MAKNVVTSAVTSAVMATGMGILKDLFTNTANAGSFAQAARDFNDAAGNFIGSSKVLNAVSNGLQSNVGNILEYATLNTVTTNTALASSASANTANFVNSVNLFNASNYYNKPPGNRVSRGFDFADQFKNPPKTYEEILRGRLQKTPVGSQIDGSELSFIDKKIPWGVDNITRISDSRFNVKRKFLGREFINSDAYIQINQNVTIKGKYFKEGIKSIKGVGVKLHGIEGISVGNNKVTDFIIHNNHGYFYKDAGKKIISSFNLQ